MSDTKKMKIIYLNVNGFAGQENKKTAKTTYYKSVAEEIRNKGTDMIFLSEINPQSEKLNDNFLEEINIEKENKGKAGKENDDKKYVILTPSATYKKLKDIKEKATSCTICLKKNDLKNYTNKGNGFDEKNDYLHFCKIASENNKEVTVLIGIHWAVGSDKQKNELDVLRTADFILSLKRLLTFPKRVNVILFGDTNANPDVKFDEVVNGNKLEAYINNYIFEHLMNELGFHEIVPEGKPYTFKGETRIERIFTNMPKDKVKAEVDQEFLEKKLSDHAALVITYEEV